MLTRLMTANALAGAMLMVTLQSTAHALPAVNSGIAKSSAITLAGNRGPGGGGGGFKMGGGGGGGFKMGGGGGGGFKMGGGGGGPRMHGGGGAASKFAYRGNGPKFNGGGGGGPRFYRGGGGSKVWRGPKFAGDYKHRHKGHGGKFRGFAFYGFPYYSNFYAYGGYGGCGWLYRNAIRTGDPYWWDRYYACRDGYYDY